MQRSASSEAGRTGFVHEAMIYGDDDEFLERVVPFLHDGVRSGEPTMVKMGSRQLELLHSAVGPLDGVTFLSEDRWRSKPAPAVHAMLELFGALVADGAERIRLIGDVPAPTPSTPWEWWGRYEAAINHIFEGFPVWSVCTYDRRTMPDYVIDEVLRTHPHLGDHLSVNPHFEDPDTFLRRRTTSYHDVLEESAPFAELVDPSAAAARESARSACRVAGLGESDTDDLTVSISEAVTNARLHGASPVVARLWAGAQRVVVTVTDAGTGPGDPAAGLLPPPIDRTWGRGLWIAHHLCSHVSLDFQAGGFTVRLVAGTPEMSAIPAA